MVRVRILVAVACAAIALPAAGRATTLQLADLRKLVSVSDPAISPDGARIAYLESRVDWARDDRDTQLQLVDVTTGKTRQLTRERKGLASPAWSPDGSRLAFLAQVGSGDDAREQVFVMPMNGGDALQITHARNGAQQFAWKPDGSAIAFVAADEPANKKAIEKHLDAFRVGNNDYLAKSAATPAHVWLVNADGTGERRLTSGSWSVPVSEPPGPPGSPLSWSPDGSQIAITRQPDAISADSDAAYVALVDATTGKQLALTQHGKFEGFPLFSPDGSQIAYWYPREGDPVNINAIWVAPAAGGNGADATHALDRNIVRALWLPDGKSLLLGAHDGTQAAMWVQPLGGAARRVNTGDVNPTQAYWLDASVAASGAIAFTGSQPGHPVELYYVASAGAAPKRLTDNNAWIETLQLGRVESVSWNGPDGFAENGTLTYPPDFVAGRRYPLVLVVHGGPNSASITSFSSLNQLLAARGYLVFSPNYRGSDNMGNAYWRAIFNDAGDGPGKDVMAGIAALEARGFVDERRIAVSGWSYGGYMTSWLIGHYHVWKAAVAGAAVNNLVDEYDLSDNNVGTRYGFLGFASPWVGDARKAYEGQSPLTYAGQVTTPTLILSDTGDARVPITQSYEMYHALKDAGVTVRFFAYPVAGHFPGDPVRATDVYRRWIDWLDRYLKAPS